MEKFLEHNGFRAGDIVRAEGTYGRFLVHSFHVEGTKEPTVVADLYSLQTIKADNGSKKKRTMTGEYRCFRADRLRALTDKEQKAVRQAKAKSDEGSTDI